MKIPVYDKTGVQVAEVDTPFSEAPAAQRDGDRVFVLVGSILSRMRYEEVEVGTIQARPSFDALMMRSG